MIKKAIILTIALILLSAVPSPSLAQPTEITLSEESARAVFPTTLDFNLAIESQAEIEDIRLHYSVDRESFAQVTSEIIFNFAPDTSVTASWSLDMRKIGGLPSGSVVDYWWTLTDVQGNEYITARQQLHFDDERYAWRSLTESNITLYWYEGSDSFAEELMSAARQGIDRLSKETGAYLEKPVKIYIYAGSGALRGAMIFPQEWTGGAAYTHLGTIVLGIAPNDIEWGKRALVHELAHLITNQMVFNPYNNIPNWLNEGLSMYAEGQLEDVYRSYLQKAVDDDALISVRTLSSPFSAFAEQSYLSYAQSYSLVNFLVNNYGQEKMFELLATFKQGSTGDGALMDVYGFDMDGLDEIWQVFISGNDFPPAVNTAGPSQVAMVIILLSGLWVVSRSSLFINTRQGIPPLMKMT
jgi:hypothetical protein